MQETIEQATLTTDAVVLALDVQTMQPTDVLLIKGKFGWSLPGGKVRKDEPIPDAFKRELEEETSLIYPFSTFIRIGVFDEPGRDPRPGRWVTFAYLWRVLGKESIAPRAGSDAKEVRWWPLDSLPEMAFDHRKIIEEAMRKR